MDDLARSLNYARSSIPMSEIEVKGSSVTVLLLPLPGFAVSVALNVTYNGEKPSRSDLTAIESCIASFVDNGVMSEDVIITKFEGNTSSVFASFFFSQEKMVDVVKGKLGTDNAIQFTSLSQCLASISGLEAVEIKTGIAGAQQDMSATQASETLKAEVSGQGPDLGGTLDGVAAVSSTSVKNCGDGVFKTNCDGNVDDGGIEDEDAFPIWAIILCAVGGLLVIGGAAAWIKRRPPINRKENPVFDGLEMADAQLTGNGVHGRGMSDMELDAQFTLDLEDSYHRPSSSGRQSAY